MRINLNNPIREYDGKPIIPQGESEQSPLTFFDVFAIALNTSQKGEMLTAEMKNKMYQITTKIYKDKNPNFTPDQLLLIKERVGMIYSPLIYGRVCAVIDGTEEMETEGSQSNEAPKIEDAPPIEK
jgi:hypothetical protein